MSKSHHSWTKWAMLIEANAQAGVQREITEHKAKGNPVFYEEDDKLIMETSFGERFEYNYTNQGIEIINKLESNHYKSKKKNQILVFFFP